MKTFLAVLLSSSLALAAPADAPVLNPHPPGRSMHLAPGEVVPMSAQCVEDTEHARREWANERTAGELADLKKPGNTTMPTVALVAIIGSGAAAVITAIALGVALASAKKP